MDYEITIRYSVDSNDTTVNDAINALLDNTLPYMVDVIVDAFTNRGGKYQGASVGVFF